jgi:hypothetical protein
MSTFCRFAMGLAIGLGIAFLANHQLRVMLWYVVHKVTGIWIV